jgi:multimeric flavodoxin WrbA
MKAVILDGSLDVDPLLGQAREVIADELGGMGWQVEALTLREMEICPCVGCFGCWTQTPGECLIDDAGRDVARSIIQSKLVVYLTPITFGGYSSELKKALDRSICLVSPFFVKVDGEVHHRPRYEHYPCLLGVGVLAQHNAESERAFANLVERNALNMHAPAHAGGMVHGEGGPEGMRAGIRALLQAMEVAP